MLGRILILSRGPVWKIESLNHYRNFFTFDGLCNMVFECPFCGYVFFFVFHFLLFLAICLTPYLWFEWEQKVATEAFKTAAAESGPTKLTAGTRTRHPIEKEKHRPKPSAIF